MTEISNRLALPYLQPAQAQKHVTHNEALRLLDALVQIVTQQLEAQDPPALPVEGTLFALSAAPTGDWTGQAGKLAVRDGNAWTFITPQAGWRLWDLQTNAAYVFGIDGWRLEQDGFDNIDGLGVGTTSDAVNRLAVASDATLLTHAGSSHRLTLNKAAPADTATLLFQSGFTGHAEIGLAGENAFSFKASADGSTWNEAIRIDPAVQQITLASGSAVQARLGATGLELNTPLTGTAVQAGPTDSTAGKLLKVGSFGLGQTDGLPAPSDNANQCLSGGLSYSFSATGTNTPLADPSGASLTVLRGSGGARVLQHFFHPNGFDWWSRSSGNNGATWASWRKQTDETGTWTVRASDSSSGGNLSSSSVTGEYVRQGSIVVAKFRELFNISTAGMTSSNTIFFSLPFPAKTNSKDSGSILIRSLASLPISNSLPTARVSAGNNSFSVLFAELTGSSGYLSVSNIASGATDILEFSITYEIIT